MSASGRASGQIDGLEALVDLLRERRADYDAVAIISLVRLGARLEHLLEGYYVEECINPWGGIEAMLTHTLSLMLNVPTMHSPMLLEDKPLNFGLIDPRKAAEAVSRTFTHCILKGLHRSPRILMHPEAGAQPGVWRAEDISCLILPDGCLGLPTLAALEQGIPVIAVRGNRNLMRNQLHELPFQSDRYFLVENYLEAAGVMAALKAGVDPSAIRRPMPETLIEQAASARHNGRATSVLAFRGSVADAAL
jgi:hypothetical protein